jgi:ribonuclease HI
LDNEHLQHDTIAQYLNSQQPQWYSPLIANLSFLDFDQHAFQPTDIIALDSDGGLRNNIGSYGAVLSINDNIVANLNGRVQPDYNILSSHRCEAYGVLAAITLFRETCNFIEHKYEDIKPQSTVICCDNKSLMDTINEWKNRETSIKFHYSADADIVKQILHEFKCLKHRKINITFCHVKGHQDRTGRDLSAYEQLNVEADRLATAALRLPNPTRVEIPTLKSAVMIRGLRVSANYTQLIRELYTSIKLKKHLKDSNQWSDQTLATIWWTPQSHVLENCRPGEQKTIIKFLHKRWACNKKENRYHGYISPFCKLCNDVIECQDHILQCQQCESRNQSRNTYLVDIRRYMESTHTDSTTIQVIITYLRNWLNGNPQPNIRTLAPEASFTLRRAVTEQNQIGWDHWFRGRLSVTWGVLYNHDLLVANHGMRNQTAESWARQLVEITWSFVLRNWTIRNELEDDTHGNADLNRRNRLINKIMWSKGKIVNFPNNYLRRLTQDQIQELPLANLKMMDSQIQALKRASGRATAALGT